MLIAPATNVLSAIRKKLPDSMAIFHSLETTNQIAAGKRLSAPVANTSSCANLAVLDECYFLHLLQQERKRSERSKRPFLLMLVEPGNLLKAPDRAEILPQITRTLASCSRETDLIGWYDYDKTLAVLFTELGKDSSAGIGRIADKMQRSLQNELGFETLKELRLTFRSFPDNDRTPQKTDLTFYPDFADVAGRRIVAQVVKRAIDVFASAAGIVLLSPLFALIAVLVKLTSEGPVLFRQKRIGQHGVPFTFLKFRSMYAGNDPKIHQEYVAKLIAGNTGELQRPSPTGVFKLTNDPRVTRLGRFLRKTSIDELPQLFNVLSGQMSLVGPRPPVPYEFQSYDLWHRRRVVEVKPGITGLWQVHGRSKTSFDEMVRLDLKYARTWSVWLDLKILCQTPAAVLSGDGAY